MTNAPQLIAIEARVLGVLIEKALTTPDQYPLSLNAATNGANQKSNRDPVTDHLQAEIAVALGGLTQKHLAGRVIGAGSRVEKFRHNAHEVLGLDDARLAIVAELLLRGPQSAGELRARVNRMVKVGSQAELLPLLANLCERDYLARRPPTAGARAETYACLLVEGSEQASSPATSGAAAPAAEVSSQEAGEPAARAPQAPKQTDTDRLERLEARVASVELRLAELFERLGDLPSA